MPNAHGDLPATRADVRALGDRMEVLFLKLDDKVQKLDDKVQKLDQELAQTREAILERTQEMVRDAQTELLRGYASFAESQEIRMRKMTADISNIDASTNLRMVVLERRLLEIEKRLHIPPPPRAGEAN
jgi:hypothetical protein